MTNDRGTFSRGRVEDRQVGGAALLSHEPLRRRRCAVLRLRHRAEAVVL